MNEEARFAAATGSPTGYAINEAGAFQEPAMIAMDVGNQDFKSKHIGATSF
jgi:hypothetical protein